MFKRTIFLLLLSFSQLAMAASFQGIGPVAPFVTSQYIIQSRNPVSSSLEDQLSYLQNSQTNLTSQLNQVTQSINGIKGFLNAQKKLQLQWVALNPAPKNLVNVVANNKNLQICNTQFMHGIHPGILTSKGCLITYGGYALTTQAYKVLAGNAATQWSAPSQLNSYQHPEQAVDASIWSSNVPVQGGYENGAVIYICKATYNNQEYVGKVVGPNCNFAVGANEVYVPDFRILVGK